MCRAVPLWASIPHLILAQDPLPSLRATIPVGMTGPQETMSLPRVGVICVTYVAGNEKGTLPFHTSAAPGPLGPAPVLDFPLDKLTHKMSNISYA